MSEYISPYGLAAEYQHRYGVLFADPEVQAALEAEKRRGWLMARAAAEDGCIISVGGLVGDIEQMENRRSKAFSEPLRGHCGCPVNADHMTTCPTMFGDLARKKVTGAPL